MRPVWLQSKCVPGRECSADRPGRVSTSADTAPSSGHVTDRKGQRGERGRGERGRYCAPSLTGTEDGTIVLCSARHVSRVWTCCPCLVLIRTRASVQIVHPYHYLPPGQHHVRLTNRDIRFLLQRCRKLQEGEGVRDVLLV